MSMGYPQYHFANQLAMGRPNVKKPSSKKAESHKGKTKRVRWNEVLHLLFVEAVRSLEEEDTRVVPVQILRQMKKLAKDPQLKESIGKLSREQVASHLQKHRIDIQTGRLTNELALRGLLSPPNCMCLNCSSEGDSTLPTSIPSSPAKTPGSTTSSTPPPVFPIYMTPPHMEYYEHRAYEPIASSSTVVFSSAPTSFNPEGRTEFATEFEHISKFSQAVTDYYYPELTD